MIQTFSQAAEIWFLCMCLLPEIVCTELNYLKDFKGFLFSQQCLLAYLLLWPFTYSSTRLYLFTIFRYNNLSFHSDLIYNSIRCFMFDMML